MSAEKNKQTLRKLFWDYDFSEDELQDLLSGRISLAGHLDRTGLYSRLLSSLDWYGILDIVGKDHLNDLLTDAVINRIYSLNLKQKYAIAKRVLSQ